MKNFISIIFVVFLISCGGGGGVDTPISPGTGVAPSGNFAGQVDPVQATD